MKRPSKYRAVRAEIVHNGEIVKCASKAEAKVLAELVLLEKAKKITWLRFHPRYPLHAFQGHGGRDGAPVEVATYVADAAFDEHDGKQWQPKVLEVKGFETEVWRLKRKLFEACYPHVELRVVKA